MTTRRFGCLLALALGAALPLFGQLTIQTTSLAAGKVGVPYSVALTIQGGFAPFRWSAGGNLPPGLTVDAGGKVVGTPTAVGTYTFTVTVTDNLNASATASYALEITASGVTITAPASLPPGASGQKYGPVAFTASGGAPPYSWAAAGLPAGLTLDAGTGALSGTAQSPGTFPITVQVVDSAKNSASAAYTLRIDAAPLTVSTAPPLFPASVGAPYSQPFAASGGTPPYRWSILSGDTGGLALDASTGNLSGTPQAAGTFSFVVQVADKTGATASKSFSVVVSLPALTITVTGALPSGAIGTPYTQKAPVTVSGGTPPYRWSVVGGGAIAPGLDFAADTLTISGTPTTAGSFSFTLQANDATGQTATRSLTVSIAPGALMISTARELPNGALNAGYSATLAAAGGAPPYTWSAVGLPDGLRLDPATGAISGAPTAAGNFAVAITVSDSALTHVSDRFTMSVSLPVTPPVTVSGIPSAANPAAQYSLQVSLAAPFPAAISGQAVLTFSPDSGPADKTVQFASGGTIAQFSIPAGSTASVADIPLAIQTGTVSGTISISVRLKAAGLDITPVPAPSITAQIGRAAPIIAGVTVTRSPGKLQISVAGYSTAREVTTATFTFGAASGQSLEQAASSIVVPVDSLFQTWFQDPANGAYGSQFLLNQPFTIQGNENAVLPQTVTLTNRVGSTTYRIQ